MNLTIKLKAPYIKEYKSQYSVEELILYIITRVVFLAIAFIISSYVEPYYTFDDRVLYSKCSLNDTDVVFCILQRQSWWAICAILNSVPLLNAIQMPRLINILLGWFCIKEFQKTMELLGCSKGTIRQGVRFIVFFPVFTMFTCSMVKDVLFVWCVWAVINEWFSLIDENEFNILKTIFCTLLGMTIRFGVVESLFGIMFVIYFIKSKGKKKLVASIFGIISALLFIRFWFVSEGSVIFEQKTRIYLGDTNTEKGTQSAMGMVLDVIHNLIGAAPVLHPQDRHILWISFLGYLSIFNVFILFWLFICFFKRHKNWKEIFLIGFLFAWMFFLSYLDTIIYRQILFVQPVIWILGCEAMYSKYETNRTLFKFCAPIASCMVYALMFIYVRV